MPERKKRGIPLSRSPLCTPHDLARAAGNGRPAAPAAYTTPTHGAKKRGLLLSLRGAETPAKRPEKTA